MEKGRLEAFTDGVIAIVITIMVLDMKAPAGTDLAALIGKGATRGGWFTRLVPAAIRGKASDTGSRRPPS